MTTMDKKTEAGDVERIGYDDALKKYATGRYLVFQFSLLIFASWAAAINNLSGVFIGADMKHTCQVPSDQIFNLNTTADGSFTIHYIPNKCTYDKLALYTNGSNITLEDGVKCDSWVYDKSEFQSTIMSEWDLNECDGKWQISLANFIYMLGYLTGCIVLADLSDRYGRSKLLLISNIGMGVSGIAASFSVNLPMLAAMRFLLGVFTAGARNSGFAHACEIVCSKYMATMTFLHEPLYAIGAVFTVGLAQLLNNWRHFQLASACLFFLGVPFYWLIPESPRWQLSMGNKDDPIKYFKISAKKSKIAIPDKLDVYLEYQPKKEGNVLSLFKTTNIRNKTLVLSSLWFTCGIVGFGMTFNVGNLAGNIFLNSYILSGAGLLTFVGIWYIDLGRRHSIASAFLITAVISVIVVVLEKSGAGSIVIACVAMLANALVGCIFMFVYVSSAEIYPTTMRVTALGMCSGLARIGGALAPFVALLNDSVPGLPYILFAVLSLAAGIIGIKVPETKGRDIPDSLHQAENELPLSSIVWCRNAKDTDSDTDEVDYTSQTKL